MTHPLITPPRADAAPVSPAARRDAAAPRLAEPAPLRGPAPRSNVFCTLDPSTCFGLPQGSAGSLAG